MRIFAVGILIKRYNCLEKIIEFADKNIITVFAGLCALVFIQYGADICPSYISALNILLEVLAGLSIIALSKYLVHRSLINIGKQTLIIYLIHMQVVQAMATRIPSYGCIDLIKPIIGLIIVYVGVSTLNFLMDKIHLSKLKPYVGIK